MLLTTLIPTFLHMVIAAFTLILVLPEKILKGWAAEFDRLDEQSPQGEDSGLVLKATGYLTIAPLLACAVPFIFLMTLGWAIFNGYHGVVGMQVLEVMVALGGLLDPVVAVGMCG